MYLFYKHIKNKSIHIILISFAVYIFVNIFENYIHYNIGHNRTTNNYIKLSNPNKMEWTKIIITMFVFALLQGILTNALE